MLIGCVLARCGFAASGTETNVRLGHVRCLATQTVQKDGYAMQVFFSALGSITSVMFFLAANEEEFGHLLHMGKDTTLLSTSLPDAPADKARHSILTISRLTYCLIVYQSYDQTKQGISNRREPIVTRAIPGILALLTAKRVPSFNTPFTRGLADDHNVSRIVN